jgi:hypothetical protein
MFCAASYGSGGLLAIGKWATESLVPALQQRIGDVFSFVGLW